MRERERERPTDLFGRAHEKTMTLLPLRVVKIKRSSVFQKSSSSLALLFFRRAALLFFGRADDII